MKQQLTVAISNELEAERLCRRFAAVHDGSDRKFKLELKGMRLVVAPAQPAAGGKNPGNKGSGDSGWLGLAVSELADYIVDEMEPELLLGIILKSDIDTGADTGNLVRYCRDMLDDTERALQDGRGAVCDGRRAKLRELLESCVAERDCYIDLRGFIAFRLQSYVADLTDTVHYVVDEYVLNRQYQEFISLLKYFVFFQETKMDEAHLIHQGENRFVMLDGNMNQLEALCDEEVVVETIDQELNYEDMVVSSLIAASPARIFIHTRQPETAAIRTIGQIFEGRTKVCQGCAYCAAIGERIKS